MKQAAFDGHIVGDKQASHSDKLASCFFSCGHGPKDRHGHGQKIVIDMTNVQ
jgi:hypothetical protein